MKWNMNHAERREPSKSRLFRRNQIIITTLAVMVAAAGYLNYAGKREMAASAELPVYEKGNLEISDEDLYLENQAAGAHLDPLKENPVIEEAESDPETENPVQYAQIDSWDQEDEAAGLENPGEAVLTSGMSVSDYIAGVQMNREQVRAKNRETLNSIINNVNITEEAKQEAIRNMIAMTEIAEKENAAETLLQAKGFVDPVVSFTDGKVDVVINAASITDQQRAQIEDIVKRKAQVGADSITITLLNLE